MFLFYNPRDVSTIQNLARWLYLHSFTTLTKAYEEVTRKLYLHMFLDLEQRTDPRGKARASFAEDGKNMLVLEPVRQNVQHR